MKKKILCMLMAVMMVVLVTGCNGKTAGTDANGGGMTICMALNGSINDKGWNYSCYKGLMDVKEQLGAEVIYTENVQDSDMESVFIEYANTKPDLIIGTGQQFYEAISKVAEQYPDIEFVCLNGDDGNGKNLTSYNFTNWEPGYIAGALAGLLTKTGKVAAIGGFEFTAIATSQKAFEAGAKAYNPECEVELVYINSFSDAGACKEASLALISQGCDVLMANASSAGLGAIEACKESGAYDIGFIDDQYASAPETVVLSALQGNDKMIVKMCQDAKDARLDHGMTILGTADGVEGVSDWHGWDKTLDADVVEKINQLVEDLKAGKISNPLE